MLRLPKFTINNATIEELRKENDRLIIQADKLLADTDIGKLLDKYGLVTGPGGSYLYGTMVYPDLDYGVLSDGITKSTVKELLGDLYLARYVRKVVSVNLVDYKSTKHSKQRPTGYWVGAEMDFEGDFWGFDIWLQKSQWLPKEQNKYDIEFAKGVSQEKKDLIMNIKYKLILNKEYGDKYLSSHVYDEVLFNGCESFEDFISKA